MRWRTGCLATVLTSSPEVLKRKMGVWRGSICFCFCYYTKVSASFLTSFSSHFSCLHHLKEIMKMREERRKGEKKGEREEWKKEDTDQHGPFEAFTQDSNIIMEIEVRFSCLSYTGIYTFLWNAHKSNSKQWHWLGKLQVHWNVWQERMYVGGISWPRIQGQLWNSMPTSWSHRSQGRCSHKENVAG